MKKFLLTFALCTVSFSVLAQELDLSMQTSLSVEDALSQQLIGYAIEVSSAALTEKKPVGRYSCDKIYSMEGYETLPEYGCELIVHSNKGPIVVRYKEVLPETDAQIRSFLKENQMDETLYYNNGRFRFSLSEEDLAQMAQEEESKEENTSSEDALK